MRVFTIQWTTCDSHEAVIDAEELAAMLAVSLDQVQSTPAQRLRELGNRGLENGLADIEDNDTYTGTTHRDIDDITETTPTEPRPAVAHTAGEIRRILDLSTAHLPPDIAAAGLHTQPGVIADPLRHGWLMWIPDDPDHHATHTGQAPPACILAIWRHARALACDYVMFDQDATAVPALPTWTW